VAQGLPKLEGARSNTRKTTGEGFHFSPLPRHPSTFEKWMDSSHLLELRGVLALGGVSREQKMLKGHLP